MSSTAGVEDAAQANMRALAQKDSALTKMTKQLGSKSDSPELRERLRSTRESALQLAQETQTMFQRLSEDAESSGSGGSRQQGQARTRHTKLRKDFEAALKSFQSTASKSVQREKEAPGPSSGGRGGRAGGGGGFGGGGGGLLGDDDEDRERQSLLSQDRNRQKQAVQFEIDHQSRMVRERDEAITAVAKDFVEINAMMTDLATLVNEQDVEIAVIADNTSKGEARTGNAAKELKQAADSQAWYRRWTCYCLLCCLLLAVFVVIIIKAH